MAAPDYSYAEDIPRGIGWVTFAGIMLGLIGTFNIIDGIVALSRSSFFVANARFVFSDLRTWGWIIMIVGGLQIIGPSRSSPAASGRAGSASPLRPSMRSPSSGSHPRIRGGRLSMFTLDILVIYGLAVYGGGRLRTQ